MSFTLDLDDVPESDTEPVDNADGKVACPECGRYFLARGLKRHITMAHSNGERVSTSPAKTGNSKVSKQWVKFQNGVAVVVSMACTQCGGILLEKSQTNGDAIAGYCSGRPKLTRQVLTFLDSTDYLMLFGAIYGTAAPMLAHHGISVPGVAKSDKHSDDHSPSMGVDSLMSFMSSMPEDVRNEIMNEAMNNLGSFMPPVSNATDNV